YLPDWKAKALLPIPFLVAVVTIVMGFKSSMLRDSGDPRRDGKLGTFSLGRCQMALWFVTVVFAYLFNYAVTGDISPIPQGVLILMGIGAGTALGSAVIDVNKRTATKADLLNWNAQNVALPQQIKDLKTKIDSTPAGDSNLPALQQQLLTSQQQLASVTAQLAQIPTTMVQPSEGFIRDVLSDANGISFHRLQVFGWTLVFWAVFVTTLFKTITMTDFDTTQLALLGGWPTPVNLFIRISLHERVAHPAFFWRGGVFRHIPAPLFFPAPRARHKKAQRFNAGKALKNIPESPG